MRTWVLSLLLATAPFAAAADESLLGTSRVETKDLRLVYFDPLGYLVPHAVRTFTNSLAWQRRMFGWVPSEATTVLLKDFSDYGGAATLATPHDRLFIDVAPLSHAFETYPASERMYTLMNHEMVHVTQGDIATEEDRRWRRFFLGKVAPQYAGSRDAALQLSDGPALHRSALVAGGRRGVHGDLDGRRARPRAGRL